VCCPKVFNCNLCFSLFPRLSNIFRVQWQKFSRLPAGAAGSAKGAWQTLAMSARDV